MSRDCVALHVKAAKALPWATLAADWPAASADSQGLPAVDALHAAYVERYATLRAGERTAQILTAIRAVAERAQAGEAVSWDGLRRLQAIVLDQAHVGFRAQPAHANSRMETYGCHPKLEAAFVRKLASDAAEELHPLLHACRLYLDVRFFHPFADGNGAAARLALQWALQQGGVRLPELTPLFQLPVHPGDLDEYRALCDLAASLLRRAHGPEGAAQ